jgi:hypothetical protein
MTMDLETRLRRANPALLRYEIGPEDLLRSVLAEPRATQQRSRDRTLSRPLALAVAILLLLGGIAAAASRFAVDYFGADDSEPTPAAVIEALRQVARDQPDYFGPIDAEHYVRLAAFDTPSGRVTIYIASATRRDSYCIASATGSEVGGGACHPNANPVQTIPYGSFGSSDYGDARPVYGRLPAGVAAIEVHFEDGETRPASLRAPWWIYVAGGEETEPGHAPVALIARGADGWVVARQNLNPYIFMNNDATPPS